MRNFDDLLKPFFEACKPPEQFRVGTEAEKFGVDASSGAPLMFQGDRGVQAFLRDLAAHHGWSGQSETPGEVILSLTRGQASITLEPGAQLELSGAPLTTIHETCAEFRSHMAELAGLSKELGIVWLGLGFHPFATQAELPWVPKSRYPIMRDYLPTKGRYALDMMRRTCTVQANFDYSSEDDAMRKMRVALALQPIVTAMFANSPFVEGKITGERSHRARVWLDVDNDRAGLLPAIWSSSSRFETYVNWALDVPMFIVKRGEKTLRATHLTFRRFMKEGLDGASATMADWETHLNTMFPEVRLKRTIEVRGADSQETNLVCALPALWKGILHDEEALRGAEVLASSIPFESAQACREDVADKGLAAKLAGKPIVELANRLLDLSMAGLKRIGALNANGQDETIHLERLSSLTRAGHTPADALLAKVDARGDLRSQILQVARV